MGSLGIGKLRRRNGKDMVIRQKKVLILLTLIAGIFSLMVQPYSHAVNVFPLTQLLNKNDALAATQPTIVAPQPAAAANEPKGQIISAGEGDETEDKTSPAPVTASVPAMKQQAAVGTSQAEDGLLPTMSAQISPPATLPGGAVTPNTAAPTATSKAKDLYAWEGSVMFLAKDIQDIEQAIMNYDLSELDKKIREQQFQSLFVDPNQQKVQIPPAPVFYLSSIVYNGPKDWTVWINGDRITTKDQDSYQKNGLKIVNVERDFVTFTWETDVLDLMVPDWQQKLKSPERKPQTAQMNPVSVKELLDQNKTRLEFILHPNQTFVVARMSIIEGKLKEVIPPPTPEQVAAAMPRATADQLGELPQSSTPYVPPVGLPSQGGSDVDPTEKYRGMKHIQEKTPTPEQIEESIPSASEAKKLLEDITTTPQ